MSVSVFTLERTRERKIKREKERKSMGAYVGVYDF